MSKPLSFQVIEHQSAGPARRVSRTTLDYFPFFHHALPHSLVAPVPTEGLSFATKDHADFLNRIYVNLTLRPRTPEPQLQPQALPDHNRGQKLSLAYGWAGESLITLDDDFNFQVFKETFGFRLDGVLRPRSEADHACFGSLFPYGPLAVFHL